MNQIMNTTNLNKLTFIMMALLFFSLPVPSLTSLLFMQMIFRRGWMLLNEKITKPHWKNSNNSRHLGMPKPSSNLGRFMKKDWEFLGILEWRLTGTEGLRREEVPVQSIEFISHFSRSLSGNGINEEGRTLRYILICKVPTSKE